QIERWQLHRSPNQFPGCQCQVESRDLRASEIQLQAKQVILKYPFHRLFLRQLFLPHAHSNEDRQLCHQEVSTAHTGVENAQVVCLAWPLVENASRRAPVVGMVLDETEIVPRDVRQSRDFTYRCLIRVPQCFY